MRAGSILIGEVFTNRGRFIINRDSSSFYKSGQLLLHVAVVMTNRGRFITNWDSYYTSGEILQIGAQQQGVSCGCIFKV